MLTQRFTVLASPSKARRPQAICPKTGEVRNQRYDDAQGSYHEGGTIRLRMRR